MNSPSHETAAVKIKNNSTNTLSQTAIKQHHTAHGHFFASGAGECSLTPEVLD
jgi:hypothetical protein